jgi:hypothetical protein
MTMHEFLSAFLAGLIGGGALAGFAGYWLATHIHAVAASAASAVTRATTVSSGDVAALNAAVSGLGNAAQSLAAAAQSPAVAAVTAAAAALPAAAPAQS